MIKARLKSGMASKQLRGSDLSGCGRQHADSSSHYYSGSSGESSGRLEAEETASGTERMHES